MGPFVFEQLDNAEKTLSYLLTPNGRLLNKGSNNAPVWEWESKTKHSFWERSEPKVDVELVPVSDSEIGNLTDHLGNVRTVITPGSTEGIAAVKQINNYYPFGLKMSLECYSISDNRYMFGGKELDDHFGLGWSFFGSRNNYYSALGIWHTPDPLSEKYVNISTFSYVSNNPIVFIDKDGREIYILTNNKNVLKGIKNIQKTSIGKNLWDKYGRNDNHDIYISAQSFSENKAGGLAYAYSNTLGIINNDKVNISQHYLSAPYTKDFSSFDGLNVSKSKGKNIHLISLNEDNIGVDGKKGKFSFDGAAYKIFHEIDAHIDKYTSGNDDEEHRKHGYIVVDKVINGRTVKAVSIRKGSDAWNMIDELINIRTNEEKNKNEKD